MYLRLRSRTIMDTGTAEQQTRFTRIWISSGHCHEPYVIITSGDAVYKMDYNKVLEYHIAKKADITVVCKELAPDEDATRFGTVKMNEDPAGSKNLRKNR